MLTKLCISVVLNEIYSDGPHEPDLCTSTIERKQYLFQRPYVKKCSLCVLPLLNRSFHVFSNFLQGTVSEKPSTQLESKVGGGGTNLLPTVQTSRLFGSISSLSLDVSPGYSLTALYKNIKQSKVK